MVSAPPAADHSTAVLVIGDGVIGLSTAYALGRLGADCVVVGARKPGMASTAAAGLLLPSLDTLPAGARALFAASLDMYPAFVEGLRQFDPRLTLLRGLVKVDAASPAAAPQRAGERAIEGTNEGGTESGIEGAIDNVRLTAALRTAVAARPTVVLLDDDPVVAIDLAGATASVSTRSGARIGADHIVLAAGAWAAQIGGLPRPLAVYPLKGQMLALGASPLTTAVVAEDVYLVPRGAETLVGATVEHAGFDLTIDPDAIAALRAAAIRACPALASAPITRTWAGTRPATPDMLPILGADPEDGRLVYACGHSKNGILLAPATAEIVSAIVVGASPRVDVAAFAVDRFAAGK